MNSTYRTLIGEPITQPKPINKCGCGGNGILILDKTDEYEIYCDKCFNLCGYEPYIDDLIDRWNTAHPDLEKRLAIYKMALELCNASRNNHAECTSNRPFITTVDLWIHKAEQEVK